MALVTYCVALLAALADPARAAYSQSAAIPLWPCNSVHRLPNTTDPFLFRFVGVVDCDCVFTLEGPAGTTLTLQLQDVLLEPSGGGYGPYGGPYGDCSRGAVRVFNFATSGALVVADSVCSSVQSSQPVETDTNMALLTSTVHHGQFLLRVAVNPAPPGNVTDLVPPSLIGTTTTTTTTTSTTTSTMATQLANLVVATEPVTSTTSRRPVPEKLVQAAPVTEPQTPRSSTMHVQAELLVQEKEDVQPTNEVLEDNDVMDDTDPAPTTTETSEQDKQEELQDVKSNLV